jgi:3-deoxy-manno-octulosonate cytidylyltransferase (CMP-KDO synthetase)
MKLVALIPARLFSKRLPKKVLCNFQGLPIIEHVRRKALMTGIFEDVIVITGDKKIIDLIKKNNGKTMVSKKKHTSGTSRCAEIASKIKADIFVIIFADEPLLLPSQIKKYCDFITQDKKAQVWNAITELKKNDLFSKNVVKCELDENNFIINFTRLPNKKTTTKSVGIMGFRRKILLEYNKLKKTQKEIATSIEQFRLINNKYFLRSVFIKNMPYSINTFSDLKKANNYFINSEIQNKILKTLLIM